MAAITTARTQLATKTSGRLQPARETTSCCVAEKSPARARTVIILELLSMARTGHFLEMHTIQPTRLSLFKPPTVEHLPCLLGLLIWETAEATVCISPKSL